MKAHCPPLRLVCQFDEPRLLSAQMSLLDRNLPAAFVASSIVSWLAAAAFWLALHQGAAWWWSVATTSLSVVLLAVRRKLPSPADLSKVRVYAQAVRWMALAVGACWGAFSLLFIQPAHPESLVIVLGLIAGINSGGLAVFSPSWPVAMAFWVACVTPAAWVLLTGPDVVSITLGLAVLTYLCTMTVFSHHAAKTTRRSIELGHENVDLVSRLRDQTQRAFEARQVAEEALREAEEAGRAKTVFLASASHDLRQPLHAQGLFLNALCRTELDEHQQALLGHLSASTASAAEMLNTLLDFSKVEAGVIVSRPQPFALQGMLSRLEQEFRPLAQARGLTLRARGSGVVLHADPALVEMMLRNLLANAVRYTEQGGVLLACRRRGGRAMVEVWDTGIGIPAHQHREIFREFHQLGNPERDRHKGLGLGLAIVDGLARAMSVDVSLASQPGRGSVFRLNLPLSQQAVVDDPAHTLPLVDFAGSRILLIDDDESVRVAMAELLTAWGCWCEAVPGVDEALAVLARFQPDLVLADYRLRRDQTGLQAVEAVRARLREPVPAMIITGDTAADRLREAHASGLALLHKPVRASLLYKTMAKLLQPIDVAASERVKAQA